MCGRMTLTRSGSEIAEYFELEAEILAANGGALVPRYNIAPSQEVATILVGGHDGAGARILEWKRWGLLPSWAKDPSMGAKLFNARSETVATKPSFRSAYRRRRCLIVADGFYEWTPRSRDHQPHYFEPTLSNFLAMAGLFESWVGEGGEVIDSCTVLTTEANADVADVHHRMPVLIEWAQHDLWMNPATAIEALAPLLVAAPMGSLEKRAVGRTVNDARRDEPACLEAERSLTESNLFAREGEPSDRSRV